MKSLTECLNEALNNTLDVRILKKYGVDLDNLEKVFKSCDLKLKGEPNVFASEISVKVENVNDTNAEKFAKSFNMTEMSDKEIKSVRMGLFMKERTWVANFDDNIGLEFCWLGAKSKTPSDTATVRVVDVTKFDMADAKFFGMIK